MHAKTKYLVLTVSLFALCFFACKKWDDHSELRSSSLNENLLQEISKRSNLAKFQEYLVKTGLDKEIGSSKTYTVWAPTNDALQSLDPAIVADSARLRQFVANHISNQSYTTGMAQTVIRVPVLNGKRVSFSTNKFDEATITEANITKGNGVLHILDKAVVPLPNAWEFVNSTLAQYKQSAVIVSQNFFVFDPSTAIVDSINSRTGEPIYRPGTGIVARNRFNDQVADLKNESRLYTFFVLNDAALQTEVDSLNRFFKTSTADSTFNLGAMSVLRNAIVDSMYTIDQLPATLTSKFGVTIPINKSDIAETRRVSNGIVYVMNKLDLSTRQKIQNVVLQGENPRGFFNALGASVNVNTTTFYRVRTNPTTGQTFNDIFVYGHGVNALNILYQAPNLPSATYKVYWVAVNDTTRVNTTINPVATLQQRLAMGDRAATVFPYRVITPNTYSEVYLGDYIMPSFGTLNMYLTANTVTTTGSNTLTLDYIRLEPQF